MMKADLDLEMARARREAQRAIRSTAKRLLVGIYRDIRSMRSKKHEIPGPDEAWALAEESRRIYLEISAEKVAAGS